MAEEITISRQELYDLVWSKPVVKIAKEFGISDVGVAKICKKMNIPKPGLGYWAKKEFGKRTRTKQLSEFNPGGVESYTIRKSVEPSLKPESDYIQQHREFEERPENKVIVKSTLRNSHPLVQEAKLQFKEPHIDRYKRCSGGRGCLNISVGKDSVHRTLRIMDALVKALSKRGFETSQSGDYESVTSVNIDGEDLHFQIYEPSKEIPNDNSNEDDSWYSSRNLYTYVPTGDLTLRITNIYHGDKAVKDTKTQCIEDRLNEFILLLIKASEYEKNRRIEREIERREYEERVREEREIQMEREQEQQRVKELFSNAADWQKCIHVRDYITEVQNHAKGNELDSWVMWANEQVDSVESRLWQPSISKFSQSRD